MSVPMEISVQNVTNGDTPHDQTANVPDTGVASLPAPAVAEDKFLVSVEVSLKPSSTARIEDVKLAVERMLEKRSLSYVDGPIDIPLNDTFLVDNVQRICVCDTEELVGSHDILLFWQVKPLVHVFQLSEEGPSEDLDGDSQLSSFSEWALPAREFDGMWESLIYESGLKQRLLRYAASALLFTQKGVDPFLVSWNRIILLHGPPGTGKTSLCKALAQKLSIRFSSRYPHCQLVEVNAHSLFSKWFSESGKLASIGVGATSLLFCEKMVTGLGHRNTTLPNARKAAYKNFPQQPFEMEPWCTKVAKLFQKIQDMVEEENNLVFVLIDEVESLAAARKAALSGSEPSDSIRVVNALLTQMDKLKSSPNVIILTTSNITAAIDIAFVDRADIKAYVGPPTLQARYEILRSCLQELLRTGILSSSQDGVILLSYACLKDKLASSTTEDSQSHTISKYLLEAAEACEGLSGRSLRKLPFLTHAALVDSQCHDPTKFLRTMINTISRERSEIPE